MLAEAAYIIKDNRLAGSEVRRFDMESHKSLPMSSDSFSKSPVIVLSFSPDGQTLATIDSEANIVLRDAASDKVRTTIKSDDRRRVTSVAFSPDGKTLAAAIGDPPGRDHEPGLIVLYDAASGQRRLTLTGHTNAVLAVAFSPDGKLLASGGADRTVRIWDISAAAVSSSRSGGR
jgi:WD40 repeat protein